jgi:hypothetical protein
MRTLSWILAAAALLGATRESEAQALSVSGSPSTLRVQTAVAGGAPVAVTDATTTYTLNSGNAKHSKIVGRLNSEMPAGVTLTITLQPPSRSNGEGAVTLSTINSDLVTSIEKHTKMTGSISYELSASLSAGIVPTQSRIVILTVISGT